MSDSNIIQILEDFNEYLSVANVVTDPIRWLLWILIQGLSYIIDGMEDITNEILLVKNFFNNTAVQEFLITFKPLIIIMFAFSFLFTGYLLIFKRKVQGDAIVINLTIALAIFTLLTPGINKMNQFTDDSIEALKIANIYNNETGTISENIIIRNMNDLYAFDQAGWKTTDVDHKLPPSFVLKIRATERFDPSELKLTNSKVAEHYLSWAAYQKTLVEFDQGGMADWNNEYYYRYDFNWFTIFTTLLVIGFTLFTIALKLAKLSYELAFNHVLAMIIAPSDLHDGTKTKKIIQNILSIFVVIILIFLSMRLYVLGVDFLSDQFNGIVYLIALLGFSLALIDGPNIVERLYGIDAGLKSGWGVLATGMAGANLLTRGVGSLMSGKNNDNPGSSKDSKNKNSNARAKSPLEKGDQSAISPFNEEKEGSKKNKDGAAQSNSAVSNNTTSSDSLESDIAGTPTPTSAPTSSPSTPTSPTSAPTSSPSTPTSPTSAPTSSPSTPTSPTSAPTSSPGTPTSPTSAPTSSPGTPTSPTSAPTSSPSISKSKVKKKNL